MKNEKKPEVTPVNARELHKIEFLAGLDAQLAQGGGDILRERLKQVPNGWRNYRLAVTLIEKVLDGIYDTVPEKTLRHMRHLRDYGQIVIRPRPMIKMPDDVQIVAAEDLRLITNRIIEAECAICIKDAAGQKGCKLRKCLMNIAPTAEVYKDGRCTYRDVVAGNELGKYI